MLDLVTVPFCTVVRFERWDAPAGRYFVAYSTRGDFLPIAGHPVIDEFATLSSPIFLGSRALLGKLYDAGISLGHRRDPEMGIDLGWPPLCIGLDIPSPTLAVDWQDVLLSALSQPFDKERLVTEGIEVHRASFARWELAAVQVAEATILATTAPLLPRQLQSLCEVASSEVVVSVATGNRLQGLESGEIHVLNAVSETKLTELRESMHRLVAREIPNGTASQRSQP